MFVKETDSIVERYRLAKAAGFKAVECAFPNVPLEELVAVQKETGLEQILLNMDLGTVKGGQAGCASFEDSLEDFKHNLNHTIEYAKALNCKKIHLLAGRHTQPTTEKNEVFYIANLRFAAERLLEEGILGLIEPINRYSVPGYYLNSFEHATKVINTVNNANLKLMLDLFHLQQIRGQYFHSIREFKEHIGHVQIAQAPDRHEPDTAGEVNFKYVLEQLQAEGEYDGWVGCEYSPLHGTLEGLKWIKNFGYDL